jgi:hypothetical protein
MAGFLVPLFALNSKIPNKSFAAERKKPRPLKSSLTMTMNTDNYIGKVILIGITFVDKQNNLIEQYQTHGIIKMIDENGMMKIERSNLPVFTLPFDTSAISEAREGLYRESSSGAEINNPDYLTSWTVDCSEPDHIERNKLYGFDEFKEE